ncbi:MAG: FHA domain-containing protein [Labilithrix sp.]|nr:FHA domain-containing protein [Labilithrix sp.]MBX3225606.1 FHA domain-containing protein [Labilithrix sp.]
MDLEIGIVCGRCEAYAALRTTTCPSCSNRLALGAFGSSVSVDSHRGLSPPPPASGSPRVAEEPPISKAPPTTRDPAQIAEAAREAAPPASRGGMLVDPEPPVGRVTAELVQSRVPIDVNGSSPPLSARSGRLSGAIASVKSSSKPKSLSLEELMDQAKNFVCRSCSTPVPVGHKFCGRCGAAVPPEIMNARTQFFGQLQAPGKAKLILIRGEGVEGLSYQLNAEQHVVGKAGQLVFPDDPFVSPRHANFFYRNGTLCVRDEGSLNGVYLRVRGSVDITPEDHFLAGEQVFRVDGPPQLNDQPGPDGTYFYSSPKHQSPFRITQVLQGGAHGMTVCARTSSLQIGREGGDLNFPTDLYMSGSHCKIEEANGALTLTDMSSRNGTYVRLRAERELGHGDYLFIGRKLLRVEITAA